MRAPNMRLGALLSPKLNAIGIFLLTLWAVLLSLIFTLQTASHTAPMRLPQNLGPLQDKIRKDFGPGKGYAILHFIPAHCSCTGPLLDQLAAGPAPGSREKIVFIGDPSAILDRHKSRGFAVEFMAAAAMEKDLALTAVPTLVIADDAERLRYVGGYFKTSSGYASQQAVIMEKLGRNETFAALPVFGCPVGSELQRFLNPLTR